jgi:hypothetical protein
VVATLVCVNCDCVVIMAGCDGGVWTAAAWCAVQVEATAMVVV